MHSPASIAATIALATRSYYVIEPPFLKLKARYAPEKRSGLHPAREIATPGVLIPRAEKRRRTTRVLYSKCVAVRQTRRNGVAQTRQPFIVEVVASSGFGGPTGCNSRRDNSLTRWCGGPNSPVGGGVSFALLRSITNIR